MPDYATLWQLVWVYSRLVFSPHWLVWLSILTDLPLPHLPLHFQALLAERKANKIDPSHSYSYLDHGHGFFSTIAQQRMDTRCNMFTLALTLQASRAQAVASLQVGTVATPAG
jgi:hypothetical protein